MTVLALDIWILTNAHFIGVIGIDEDGDPDGNMTDESDFFFFKHKILY